MPAPGNPTSNFMADTPAQPSSTDAVADAAAYWCMRLHDRSCSEDDRQAFDRWVKSDPAHAAEYQAMLEIWTVSGLTSGDRVRVGPAPSRSAWRRLQWPTAAGVLLAVLLGWAFGLVPHIYESYRAAPELRGITLADGSSVQLNRGTSLTYLDFRDRRQVILDDGEAYFKVRHDSVHPFIVTAGDGRIVVTGTAFNVWKYGGAVVVTLQEGSVSIVRERGDGSGYSVDLSPGRQARYDDGDELPKVTVANAPEALAWREGKLVINDLPLAEALPLINRYLDRPAELADPATGELRMGGIFNTDDMPGLVMRLPKVLPVRVEQSDRGNIVIKRRDAASG